MLCALAPEAEAALFIVTSNVDAVDASPGNGICASAGGVCTLRAAVQESNALAGSDTIDLPGGLGPFTITLLGTDNLAAVGDLDIAGDVTIVGNGNVIDGLGTSGIFHILQGGSADISELTLQNGWGTLVGGAIYNQGDLVLSDCTLVGNAASSQGGAIKNISPGTLLLDTCDLIGNTAASGGAIYSSGELEIVGSTIELNVASGAGGGFGGGLFLTSNNGLPTEITDSFIGYNDATDRGGGAMVLSALNISGSSFEGNTAGLFGGGLHLYTENAVVDVFLSELVDNAADEGGGIHNFWGEIKLRQVRVSGNSAVSAGGGINNQGIMLVKRSAIYDNDANLGAGLYNYWSHADLTVSNSTVSGNAAATVGGGVYLGSSAVSSFNGVTIYENTGTGGVWSSATGSATLTNTIASGNLDVGGLPSDCQGTITSTGHNLIEDTTGCTIGGAAVGDIYGVAAGLGTLGLRGGTTPSHNVLAASPARDAGDAATCFAVDQRGAARPGGAVCDIGSFERQ